MSATYPSDSVQHYVDPWWIETQARQATRGALLWAFLAHVDQEPLVLVTEGREEATVHETANYSIAPLDVRRPPAGARLPVAGLPHYPGEVRTVHRSKRRPAVVLSTGGSEIPRELRTGAARYQTNQTLLVAPYYGADQGGTRGGWRQAFVDRIRRLEYPQYLWDSLPVAGASESILRLDHIQPLGKHGDNYDLTGYMLSEDALLVVDEWLVWLFKSGLPEDGILADIRSQLVPTG